MSNVLRFCRFLVGQEARRIVGGHRLAWGKCVSVATVDGARKRTGRKGWGAVSRDYGLVTKCPIAGARAAAVFGWRGRHAAVVRVPGAGVVRWRRSVSRGVTVDVASHPRQMTGG